MEISHDQIQSIVECIKDDKQSILNNSDFRHFYESLIKEIKDEHCLFSYLLTLSDSLIDSYIKLTNYTNLTPRKLKSTEFILNENGKYGILLNLISNRKTFNFSIRIRDMTIISYNEKIQKMTRGGYRSFTLTDRYGNISENWKTLKIYSIIEKKKIFDNHSKSEIVTYDSFISDNFVNYFKTINYFLLKLIINRIEMERDYWKNLKKQTQPKKNKFYGDCKNPKNSSKEK